MNKCTIIGNLTRDPENRATQSGVPVCNFTVAVNRRVRGENGQQEADFFRVSAWRQLGDICARYLAKGRKVCVIGPVSVRTYQANDGSTRALLEITADDVEFLTGHNDLQATEQKEQAYQEQERQAMQQETMQHDTMGGFTSVGDDDLPF